MKRTSMKSFVLSLALFLCFIISMSGVVSASAVTVSSFEDVDSSHWAYDFIDDAVQRGLFVGTSSTTFEPETTMSRAMFVTVLSHLNGVSVDNSVSTRFADVESGTWYTGAVAWAANNGITSGTSSTTFSPNDPVTREQMATLIVHYAAVADVDLPEDVETVTFSDASSISSWAKDAVAACQRAGIMVGVGGNVFSPQGASTRAQAAVVFSRCASLNEKSNEPVLLVKHICKAGETIIDSKYDQYFEGGNAEAGVLALLDAGQVYINGYPVPYEIESGVYNSTVLDLNGEPGLWQLESGNWTWWAHILYRDRTGEGSDFDTARLELLKGLSQTQGFALEIIGDEEGGTATKIEMTMKSGGQVTGIKTDGDNTIFEGFFGYGGQDGVKLPTFTVPTVNVGADIKENDLVLYWWNYENGEEVCYIERAYPTLGYFTGQKGSGANAVDTFNGEDYPQALINRFFMDTYTRNLQFFGVHDTSKQCIMWCTEYGYPFGFTYPAEQEETVYEYVNDRDGILVNADVDALFEGDSEAAIEKLMNEGKVIVNGFAFPISENDVEALKQTDANDNVGYTINGYVSLWQNEDASWDHCENGRGNEGTFSEIRMSLFNALTKKVSLTTMLYDEDNDGFVDRIETTIKESVLVDEIIENADGTLSISHGSFIYEQPAYFTWKPLQPSANNAVFAKENFDELIQEGSVCLYWEASDGWHIESAEATVGLLTEGEDHGYYLFDDERYTDGSINKVNLINGNRAGQYLVAHLALGLQDEEVIMWSYNGYPISFTSANAETMLAKAIENVQALPNQTTELEEGIAAAQAVLDDAGSSIADKDLAIYNLYLMVSVE